MPLRISKTAFICSSLFLFTFSSSSSPAATTTRVSINSSEEQGNSYSVGSKISHNGRYVGFDSLASNLSSDTNNKWDVFVRDRVAGTTARVSVSSNGNQSNGDSYLNGGSSDGRYVLFMSTANNLVANDSNAAFDIFVHDRQTSQTTRVSVKSNGGQANGASRFADMSSNGSYVVFQSTATNLVANDTNGVSDIFFHDRQAGQTWRVSVSSTGQQATMTCRYPYVTDNGRYVSFNSKASNLVAGDTNNKEDVFIRDRQSGQTIRVSVKTNGGQANGNSTGGITAGGRYVLFYSTATNLVTGDTNGKVDVFVRDLQTSNTQRVSLSSSGIQGNGDSYPSGLSNDGRYVCFTSGATNLVDGDTNASNDVFVRDRQTGLTTRVSVKSNGQQANDYSWSGAMTPDGRFIVIESNATNLVSGDTNAVTDVFLHKRW